MSWYGPLGAQHTRGRQGSRDAQGRCAKTVYFRAEYGTGTFIFACWDVSGTLAEREVAVCDDMLGSRALAGRKGKPQVPGRLE